MPNCVNIPIIHTTQTTYYLTLLGLSFLTLTTFNSVIFDLADTTRSNTIILTLTNFLTPNNAGPFEGSFFWEVQFSYPLYYFSSIKNYSTSFFSFSDMQ